MKRLFSLLIFCLLLLVSAAALAAPYGVHPYIRVDNKGNANASLFLFYTQSGVFASVATYDVEDGNAPIFKGVGVLENGTLVLEDYLFDVDVNSKEKRHFAYPSQPLPCEARVNEGKQVVLLPTVDLREMGVTKISEPDISGTYKYKYKSSECESYEGVIADYRLALYFLKKLHVENTGLDLCSNDYRFDYDISGAWKHNNVLNSYMLPGDYYAIYVYNKNDELVMTYYVHLKLWNALRVNAAGEVKILCSNDAVG